MGGCCGPQTRSSVWDVYEKNREIYIYESDNGIRLVGIKSVGQQIYCYVESCVLDDLQREFLPRDHKNRFLYEPFVIIQPTVSNPTVYKYVDSTVLYSQFVWLPFIPQSTRENANRCMEYKANKIKSELLKVFEKAPVFRRVSTAKVQTATVY